MTGENKGYPSMPPAPEDPQNQPPAPLPQGDGAPAPVNPDADPAQSQVPQEPAQLVNPLGVPQVTLPAQPQPITGEPAQKPTANLPTSDPKAQPPVDPNVILTEDGTDTPSQMIVASTYVPEVKKRPGRTIAIIAGVVILVAGLGYIGYVLLTRKSPEPSPSATVAPVEETPTPEPISADLNCGFTLSKKSDDQATLYVTQAKWPTGFAMHDTGGDDSMREYCIGAKLKGRAEEYIAALSEHDWTKAYTFVTKAEAAATSFATRSAYWQGGYGSYTFSPSNYPVSSSSQKISYALEPDRKAFPADWSKEISLGSYKTPVLVLDAARGVTTQISLAMQLEDGIWKVAKETNDLKTTAPSPTPGAAPTAKPSK